MIEKTRRTFLVILKHCIVNLYFRSIYLFRNFQVLFNLLHKYFSFPYKTSAILIIAYTYIHSCHSHSVNYTRARVKRKHQHAMEKILVMVCPRTCRFPNGC